MISGTGTDELHFLTTRVLATVCAVIYKWLYLQKFQTL